MCITGSKCEVKEEEMSTFQMCWKDRQKNNSTWTKNMPGEQTKLRRQEEHCVCVQQGAWCDALGRK